MPPWRQLALTRADELEALATSFEGDDEPATRSEVFRSIRAHLSQARMPNAGKWWWSRVRSWVSGSEIERVHSSLSAAEADLLRVAPDSFLLGELESILRLVEEHLPFDDPRRTRAKTLVERARNTDRGLKPEDRELAIAASRGASSVAAREYMMVRSFRNVLLVAAAVLLVAALGLGTFASFFPDRIALCFTVEAEGTSAGTAPQQAKVVCPAAEEVIRGGDKDAVVARTVTPLDVWLVELLGVLAAAIAAATSLRNIQGTTTPFAVPVALAVLKLPTGALTAVLGILLMRGQFIPGLSALDFPAQILGWAIVFGYAQQVFTGVVDTQANRVLNGVRGSRTRVATSG